jgi:hypothetical protein
MRIPGKPSARRPARHPHLANKESGARATCPIGGDGGNPMFILLALWAAIFFGGLLFGRLDAERTRRMPRWSRVGSSAVLALAAWGWAWVAWGQPSRAFALLIAVGMSCGLLGDLFMARVIRLGNRVAGGMASFGLGHVAYIAALLTLGGLQAARDPATRWLAWGAWLVVGLAGWYLAVYRGGQPGALRWAALPYALLLATTAGLAWGLAIETPHLWPLAAGSTLFLLSDLLLANRVFNKTYFYRVEDLIWLAYGPGQALIVFGGWI